MPVINDRGPVIGLGIAGCVDIPEHHLESIKHAAGMQVVSICDPDPTCARLLARELSAPIALREFDDLIELPDIDAVYLSSAFTSGERASAAVKAGKHLLLARLFGASTRRYMDLNADACAEGVQVMPAFERRFMPAFGHARRMIEEGALGPVRQVRCELGCAMGGRRHGDAEGELRALLFERAAHTIDLCRWWLGDVHTVSADLGAPRASGRHTEFVNLILNHERGISVHHIRRMAEEMVYERYHLDGDSASLEISARGDAVSCSSDRIALAIRQGGGPTRPLAASDSQPQNGFAELLAHFAACAGGGARLAIGLDDVVAAVEVIHAACLAAVEGSKITLPVAPSLEIGDILRRRIG